MGLDLTTIQAASKGIDNDGAPSYIAADQAPILRNFLPGRKGRLPLRGGAHTSGTPVDHITDASSPVQALTANLPNPSFDVDLSGWSSFEAMHRDTVDFDSAPASLWIATPASPATSLAAGIPGTFLAGTTYTLTFRTKVTSLMGASSQAVTFTLGQTGDVANLAYSYTDTAWHTVTLSWTPATAITGASFILARTGALTRIYVDSFELAIASPTQLVAGPWTYDDRVLMPTNGSNQGTVVDLPSFTKTSFGSVTSTTTKRIGASYARLGDYVYGVGSDAAIASPSVSAVLRWDGSTGGSPLATYVNAPRGGVAVKTHLSRLFMLASGSTVADSKANSLYWSDVLGPTADTAAVWQDDATGLTNQIKFPDDGEVCVGLALLGRNLLVLRSRSLWVLTGDTPSSFALRRAASIGIASQTTVVEYNDGVFFADSLTGSFYFFDGTQARRVSDPIRGTVTAGAAGPTIRAAARVDDEFLIVGTCAVPGSPTAEDRVWLFHAPTGAWSEFTSDAMLLPSWFGRTLTYSFMVAGALIGATVTSRIWDTSALGRPCGGNTPGTDRLLSAPPHLIPALVRTRAIKLASPRDSAQLRALLADYDLATNGVENDALFRVTGLDDNGATLFTADLPSSAAAGRRRKVVDAYGEVLGAAQLEVALVQTTAQAFSTCELQDLTIEAQTTRHRTG